MTLKQYVPPVTWVDNPETMLQFVSHVRDTGECAVDTETTGLNRSTDSVVFWSACPEENSRYCFSRDMLPILQKELIRDPKLTWYYTNQSFDFDMLLNSGVETPAGECYDTLAMDWLADENRQGQHGLKETAKDHLGFDMRSFKEAFPGRKRGETLPDRIERALEEDHESSIAYSSLDAWATFRVFHHLRGNLQKQTTFDGMPLWEIFRSIEMPFTRVLHSCSRRGIMMDAGYLEELSPKIEDTLNVIHKKINRIAGTEINLRSTPQLRALLFDKLGLPVISMTKGGSSGVQMPSTDEGSLNVWAGMGIEVAQLMLKYRELSKLKGTYVDGLLKRVDKYLRIHPTLTQHVAVTGRLSSVDPNLQNIPRPENDPFLLRGAFIPKDGYVFVVVDYAQIEMRLLAHFAQDRNMIDVMRKGWDIHMGTASLMYGYAYDDIKSANKHKKAIAEAKEKKLPFDPLSELEEAMLFARQAAKTIGFGQQQAEVKPTQNGETYVLRHRAIPCCAARRSVSTCDHRQMILNDIPASSRLGSHSRKLSLTRWVKSVGFGIWQRSFASTVGNGLDEQAIAKNAALNAVENTTSRNVKTDGTGRTRRKGTIRRDPGTTPGRAASLRPITRKWPENTTGRTACDVVNLPFWFTTSTEIDPTAPLKTSKSCANAATKSTCTTAPGIFPNSGTLQRYSQSPGKPGIETLNYGEGPAKLGKSLGISKEAAEALITKYFAPYPNVQRFIDGTHSWILDHGKVETILSRPRRFPGIVEIGEMLKHMYFWQLPQSAKKNLSQANRQSVNSIIQGSAADVAKMSMLKCEYDPILRNLGVEMLLQIHDEIIFEVPEESLKEAEHRIIEIMEHPFDVDLLVPLNVDCGHGYSWASAKG